MHATMFQAVSSQGGFSGPVRSLNSEDREFIADRGHSCEFWLQRAAYYRALGCADRADECRIDAERAAVAALAVAEGRA